MASAKAENRYGMHGSKFEAPEKEAGREAERTAGTKPKEPGKKVTKVGSDPGPAKKPAEGRYSEETSMEEMHVHHRHAHEREALHHHHMHELHEAHRRHHMEHHHAMLAGERDGEHLKKMHERHHEERRHMHTRHEHAMTQMHERHESELAAPGEEASERKPTDRPLSLVGGRK